MDVSNYNKREKGKAKVTSTEWQKLAKILEVPVEEIYESEESTFIICKDQSVGINHGANNVYTIPAYFLKIRKIILPYSKKKTLNLRSA